MYFFTKIAKIKTTALLLIFLILFISNIFLRFFFKNTNEIQRNSIISQVELQAETLKNSINSMNEHLLLLVQGIQHYHEHGFADRETVIDFAKELWTLENDAYIHSVQITYGANMYDGLDQEYSNDARYPDDGIFSLTICKNNNEFRIEPRYEDTYQEWYTNYKKSPINAFSFENQTIHDTKTAVASISTPIINKDDAAIGMVGLSYDSTLYEDIINLPLFDQCNTFIITQTGEVLYSYFGLDEAYTVDYFMELDSYRQQVYHSSPVNSRGYEFKNNILFITIPINIIDSSTTLFLCYSVKVPGLFASININTALFVITVIIIIILSIMLITFSLDGATDPLTGVYNRTAMTNTLPAKIKRSIKYNSNLSIVMCDLDKFKQINDTYGHLCGDYVLKTFSSILNSNIRKNDWICRYGGEEFLIYLHNTDRGEAILMANRIRKQVEETEFVDHNRKFYITVSMGVIDLHSVKEKNMPELIEAADKNLYIAKKSGRNKVI